MTVEDLKSRIADLEQQLITEQRKCEKLETRAMQGETAAEKAVIRSRLEDAARKSGLHPGWIESEVNLQLETGQWKVTSKGEVYRHDTSGHPEMSTTGEYVGPLIAMKQVAKTKPEATIDGGYQSAPQAGSAARSSDKPNPWTREHWNITHQSEVIAENGQAEAARLAAAAGASLFATHPPAAK